MWATKYNQNAATCELAAEEGGFDAVLCGVPASLPEQPAAAPSGPAPSRGLPHSAPRHGTLQLPSHPPSSQAISVIRPQR